MELLDVELQGFRRFADSTSVRMTPDLIAIVGQNEAGKSSFLDALEELNHEEEFSRFDQTRDAEVPTKVSARFLLDESDWTALSDVDDGEEITHCTFEKRESGRISVELDPKPSHDLAPRRDAATELEGLKNHPEICDKLNNNLKDSVSDLIDDLANEDGRLPGKTSSNMEDLVGQLKNLVEDENSQLDQDQNNEIRERIGVLQNLVEHESDYAPRRAKNILLNRRPYFLKFEENDRELENQYDLDNVHSDPPKALRNLAELAELDLSELHGTLDYEPRKEDLIEDANETLEEKFSQAWVREDVVPVLSVSGSILNLMVRTPDERNRSTIEERSDGLRWFVALLGFMNSESNVDNPILLVDEAESHLSYDAQASLIEVLETQEIAQQVVYTTHSAGCLPSDLGTGIRPVIPEEGERSTIENGFWSRGEGFSPLMMAMGLSPLAFTVGRNSLIAEGPSETVLLPTLLRQGTGSDALNYQVAPGLASIDLDELPSLLSETGRAAIVLDGDESGEEMKEQLEEAIDDPERLRTLGDLSGEELVFEDLIEKQAYADAFNEELETWQLTTDELDPAGLPDSGRAEFIQEWMADRDIDRVLKTELCQRLAEKAGPDYNVVEPSRRDVLVDLHEWASQHFVSPDNYILE